MSLDSFKEKVQSLLEKKQKNTENIAEFDAGFQNFEAASAHAGNLDDSIRRELDQMMSEYQKSRTELADELQLIQEERTSMASEIQGELAKLNTAMAKLDAASKGKYGAAFEGARKTCEACIQDYRALLEKLETDAAGAGSDAAAGAASLGEAQAFLSELQIREQAVNMLVSVTLAQHAAISYYTGSGYNAINPRLRGQSSSCPPEAERHIRELHGLLSRQRTTVPVTLYRGISPGTPMVSGSTRGLDSYSDRELCGKLLVDGAFVSTSMRESAAFSGTMLVLNAPAGTRGAYVADVSSTGRHEREFLMDCKQVFRVTKVEHRDGKRYIYANVLTDRA